MTKAEALRVLELPSKYTENELKQAYRAKARKYHPDANGGKTAKLFMEAGEAYDLLTAALGDTDCKLTHVSIFKFKKA